MKPFEFVLMNVNIQNLQELFIDYSPDFDKALNHALCLIEKQYSQGDEEV